jgi:hypothetical protein
MILDAVQFIVYYRTASAEAALKSLKSPEARRTAIALRLRRRRRSLLYDIAERALYMERVGVDRRSAVEQLASEFRFRLEDELARAKNIFNFVVYAASMVVFTAIILGVVLGILSPIGGQAAALVTALVVAPLFTIEGFMPPIRRWDYWISAAFMAPAAAAYFVPQAALATVPAAAIYALWYYIPRYREAEEEFRMAARGGLAYAATPMGKQAAEIMKAVRYSGSFDLQAAAEYMMRLAEHHYSSLRREGLIRALVTASLVLVAALAVVWLYPQLTSIAAQAQGSPLPLYITSPKPMMWLLSFMTAVVAGRMTESYAAAPLYSPLVLSVLFV